MPATLTNRANVILEHLLAAPDADHTIGAVAAATDIAYHRVASVFALLAGRGVLARRDVDTWAKPYTLTAAGRDRGRALFNGDGMSLAELDRVDPRTADRVRARMGWPLRHAS